MNIINVIHNEKELHWRQILKCVWSLSIPAMLAQTTYIVMEYIDAAMVGSLGAAASASIGLVAPVLWFLYGIGMATVQGFSVRGFDVHGGSLAFGHSHGNRQHKKYGCDQDAYELFHMDHPFVFRFEKTHISRLECTVYIVPIN